LFLLAKVGIAQHWNLITGGDDYKLACFCLNAKKGILYDLLINQSYVLSVYNNAFAIGCQLVKWLSQVSTVGPLTLAPLSWGLSAMHIDDILMHRIRICLDILSWKMKLSMSCRCMYSCIWYCLKSIKFQKLNSSSKNIANQCYIFLFQISQWYASLLNALYQCWAVFIFLWKLIGFGSYMMLWKLNWFPNIFGWWESTRVSRFLILPNSLDSHIWWFYHI
jgi:hypothetical protein